MPNDKGESTPSYRISVRFGDAILQAGHTAIPNLVLEHYSELGITPAEMMFCIHIWRYWWTERDPYPSLQAVADKMGVTRRQTRNYTQSLKEKGYLNVHERQVPGLGQVTSEYDFSALLQAVVAHAPDDLVPPRKNSSEGGRKDFSEAPRNHSSPEEYEEQQDSGKEDSVTQTSHPLPVSQGLSPSKFEIAHTQENPEPEKRADEPDRLHEPTPPQHSFEALRDVVGRLGTTRQSQLVPPPATELPRQGSDDPIQSPPTQPRRRRTRQETDLRMALRPYLEQYAEQLGDEAPLSSTMTRAVHLFERSTLTIDGFIAQLQQAQRETQRRSGSIQKQRSRGGPGPFKNKMSYFFGILEDYLGLKELPLRAASGNQSVVPHREPSAPRAPRRRTVGGPMVRVDSLRHNDDDALTPPERPFSARRSPSDGLEAAHRMMIDD